MTITPEEQFELALKQYRRDIRLWSRTRWRIIPGYEQSDLEADMMAVLWKAVDTYNPRNGSKFANYFRTLRDREYISLVRKVDAEKRQGEKHWRNMDAMDDPWDTTERWAAVGGWSSLDRASLTSLLVPSSEDSYLEREEAEEVWRESRQTA